MLSTLLHDLEPVPSKTRPFNGEVTLNDDDLRRLAQVMNREFGPRISRCLGHTFSTKPLPPFR